MTLKSEFQKDRKRNHKRLHTEYGANKKMFFEKGEEKIYSEQ